uniref:Longitudinals lacking protein, isoforms A/B/D/L n=1 Tax=Cacopsylla melanoneura TaxID=428564 RepID=A0A8D8Z3Y0_9HEMI
MSPSLLVCISPLPLDLATKPSDSTSNLDLAAHPASTTSTLSTSRTSPYSTSEALNRASTPLSNGDPSNQASPVCSTLSNSETSRRAFPSVDPSNPSQNEEVVSSSTSDMGGSFTSPVAAGGLLDPTRVPLYSENPYSNLLKRLANTSDVPSLLPMYSSDGLLSRSSVSISTEPCFDASMRNLSSKVSPQLKSPQPSKASMKKEVKLSSPLKAKMLEYEEKMQNMRESIRQKRAAQGLTCQQCGRSYCRPYNLKRHIQYECGKAPQFPCFYCSYRARHKHDLKKHVTFKHAAYVEHFQAMQDQLENAKLESRTLSELEEDKGFATDATLQKGFGGKRSRKNKASADEDTYDFFSKTLNKQMNQTSDYVQDESQYNDYSSNYGGVYNNRRSSVSEDFIKRETPTANDEAISLKVKNNERSDNGAKDNAFSNGKHPNNNVSEERAAKSVTNHVNQSRNFFNGDGVDIKAEKHSPRNREACDSRVENIIQDDKSNDSMESDLEDHPSANEGEGGSSSDIDHARGSNSSNNAYEYHNGATFSPLMTALMAQQQRSNNAETVSKMMTDMNPLVFQQRLHALMLMNSFHQPMVNASYSL